MVNPMTAKGDLIAGGTAGAATRLGVGSNGQVMTADSAQTLGVKWATPAASGGSPPNVNPQTGTTYTLALTDAPAASSSQGIVTISNAAAIALTVPLHASVAWLTGTVFQVIQLGAGQITVSCPGGSLVSAGSLATRAQYSAILLTYLGSDLWSVGGDLA